MGTAVPLSNKYIIHSAQIDNGDDLAHLQLENCSHLLLFFVGPMNVVFLAAEGETDDTTLSKESVDKNAKRSFRFIRQDQRPVVRTFANIEGFVSKCWLAINDDLKSANDHVIDCDIKCSNHKHNDQWYYGGPDCEACAAGVEVEIRRVHDLIQRRQPPFVLKLTQCLSSVRTNIVKDENEKKQLLEQISEYLSAYLPRITKENVHLDTTTLILSDHLDGGTMALNFYVRRDGSPAFWGACNQLATGESGRQSTCLVYADQDKYEPKYRTVLEKIDRTLHDAGYYGAVGADIMEDENGTLNVIDLNVRTPLSLLLYLLKGHFYKKRGYGVSLVYECVMLKISREEMEEEFSKGFEEARIVLLGSTRLGKKDQWAYGMVVAGEEMKDVEELSDRIFEYEL